LVLLSPQDVSCRSDNHYLWQAVSYACYDDRGSAGITVVRKKNGQEE
jgi:hypothetical protein